MNTRSATVYCSSSDTIDARYVDAATTLARLFAENEISLIYGGGNVGLMGHMARTVHDHDGYVVGVIPKAMMKIEGVGDRECDELHLTDTMRERKRIMYERGDA
ncbi:MAG: TIGR00730 family Rossman fold protein, partial [Rhodothermales bacterium]|nr:TIGR00730 family Rossman fold protein [Rhodothermales bacterium]